MIIAFLFLILLCLLFPNLMRALALLFIIVCVRACAGSEEPKPAPTPAIHQTLKGDHHAPRADH